MSATFDPYHKWLGILPKDQPPHHYRLLGLEPFEEDLQVIEAAADRQLGFLRKFQSGEHAVDCQKLLNEVSRARLCLLKPATKANYDEKLREQLEGPAAPTIEFVPLLETSGAGRKSRGPGVGAWVSVAVILLLLVGGVAYLFSGKADGDKPKPPDVAGSTPEKKPSDPEPEKVATATNGGTDSGKETKLEKPDPTPDARGQISILPLLKSSDAILGSWSVQNDRLESLAHNSRAQVKLPVKVPAEYTLHIEGMRLKNPGAPTNTCAIGLVCGNDNCIFGMEVDPKTGSSGLELVDGKDWQHNSTSIPGLLTPVGKPFRLDAIVRKDGIEIRVDDRTVVDWKGSFNRLQRSPGHWDQSDPKKLFIAAESKYVFTKVVLGPPLAPLKLPGGDLKPGESVELLQFVDLKRDVWNGVWEKHGAAIKNRPGIPVSRFSVPYQVPDEYELVTEIECEEDGRDFVLGVPFQAGYVGIGVGGRSGHSNCLLIDYAAFFREPHIVQEEAALVKGKNRVVVTVQRNHFIVKVNDRKLFDWKGDPRRYIAWPEYATPGQRVTIGTNGFGWQVNSLKLTRLAPAPDVFSEPAEPKEGDLLAIVDVDRDATQGVWTKTAKGIESTTNNSTGLHFPAKLPADYEFRLVAARKSGVESLVVGFPVAGRAIQVDLGFRGGTQSGICWVEDQPADRNSTTLQHSAELFPVGQPTVVSGRVDGRHLKLEVGGKVLWDLDIPDALKDRVWMLRAGWLTPEERLQMSVVTWETAFEIQEVRFRSLNSPSPPFPPINLAGGAKPASNAGGNPGQPLVREGLLTTGETPVPDAAAQDAAGKKLREIFKDQFAGARKDADKLSLAQKLEALADETDNDPAAKYVCLEEARRLAAEAGDLTKAFAQVDKVCAEFKSDELELKAATLKSVAPKLKGPLLNKELIDKALPLIEQLVAAERFDTAGDLIAAASQSALKAKERALISDLNELRKSTSILAKEFSIADKARTTLQTSPDDAPANLAWGQWVCLHHGKWEEGLKLLQRSGSGKLQDLATRDLQNPSKKEDIQQLGADWLEYARSKKDHTLAGFADRAEFWLTQASAGATGLAKTRIDSQIADAVATSDWNSPLPALLIALSEKVVQKRYVLSDQITGGDGYDFQHILPTGGLLIGFNVYTSPSADQDYILGLQAVFATPQGVKLGDLAGKGRGTLTEIRARPGYAVNGVTCHSGTWLNSLQVSFARITRSGLDPKRSYLSPLVGQPLAQPPRSISSGSLPVVGITGRSNDHPRGLGLVIAK